MEDPPDDPEGGMEVRDFYGSLSGAPFTDDSARMVALAAKF
jgi:hypothetical protein